jgi:hypothetical protein
VASEDRVLCSSPLISGGVQREKRERVARALVGPDNDNRPLFPDAAAAHGASRAKSTCEIMPSRRVKRTSSCCEWANGATQMAETGLVLFSAGPRNAWGSFSRSGPLRATRTALQPPSRPSLPSHGCHCVPLPSVADDRQCRCLSLRGGDAEGPLHRINCLGRARGMRRALGCHGQPTRTPVRLELFDGMGHDGDHR